MSNIYLLSVSYSPATLATNSSALSQIEAIENRKLVVRAGYFGLCASGYSDGVWICANGAFGIRSTLGPEWQNPHDTVGVAAHFKDNVAFPGLL